MAGDHRAPVDSSKRSRQVPDLLQTAPWFFDLRVGDPVSLFHLAIVIDGLDLPALNIRSPARQKNREPVDRSPLFRLFGVQGHRTLKQVADVFADETPQ